jgi:acetoin utilization deacetylase AcuC-like enzyme
MRPISIVRHENFRLHETPGFHPESPGRLEAIDEALAQSDVASEVVQLESRLVKEDELCLVHDPAYIEMLVKRDRQAKERNRTIGLDGDTYLSPASYDIAKLAVGGGLNALESVTNGRFLSSFVSVRPPGHHARVRTQMGFCIFNNIAVAAQYALNHLGYKRVMILDWDVHHGNGTQEIFYNNPAVCFLSLHQYPFYPHNSGWFMEDGADEGKGFNINIPLPEGTGDRGYLAAWDAIATPIVLEYEPDLILVSAGYDAHIEDPLGQQKITTVGYAMLTQRLLDLSNATKAKVVCFLEGGYDLSALAESVVATMRVLSADTEERSAEVHVSYIMPNNATGDKPVTGDRYAIEVDERIEQVRKHFSNYWKCLR